MAYSDGVMDIYAVKTWQSMFANFSQNAISATLTLSLPTENPDCAYSYMAAVVTEYQVKKIEL